MNNLASAAGVPSCYTGSAVHPGYYLLDDATQFVEPSFKGPSCFEWRLPTEAEWEYAARSGTITDFYNGSMVASGCNPVDPKLDAAAWFCGNAQGVPHPVGGKLPNMWGLYDMLGNVSEWGWDWYGPYTNTGLVDS